MSLVPQHWNSEIVSPSLCEGLLRVMHRTPEALSITQPQSKLVLSQKLQNIFFLELDPWDEGLGVGLVCQSTVVASVSKISLLTFIQHVWVWEQSIPHLCPFYQSHMASALNC